MTALPGRSRRLVAGVAIVVTALSLRPAVTSAGALLPELQQLTGMSGAVAGALTSLPPVCFGVFGLLGARWGRRFGTVPTLLTAMIVTAAALVARVVGDSAATLVLWTVPALAGMAVGNVLLPVAVKRWFPDRIGAATGWYAVSLALGTAAAAGLSVPLATLTGSVRFGLAAWALPALLAAGAWLWLREGPPALGAPPATDRAVVRAVRRHRTSWGLTVYFGLQSLAAYVVMGWLPSIYRDAGVSAEGAGLLLALLMLVGVPVSFGLPLLATRRDDQRHLVVGLAASAGAGYAGLLFVPATLPWLWAMLMGLGMGAFPLALVMIGLRTTTTAGTAELSSLAQGLGYLIAASGPVTFGLLHDATGSWTPPLSVLIGLLVPQLLAGLVAARPDHVDVGTAPVSDGRRGRRQPPRWRGSPRGRTGR